MAYKVCNCCMQTAGKQSQVSECSMQNAGTGNQVCECRIQNAGMAYQVFHCSMQNAGTRNQVCKCCIQNAGMAYQVSAWSTQNAGTGDQVCKCCIQNAGMAYQVCVWRELPARGRKRARGVQGLTSMHSCELQNPFQVAPSWSEPALRSGRKSVCVYFGSSVRTTLKWPALFLGSLYICDGTSILPACTCARLCWALLHTPRPGIAAIPSRYSSTTAPSGPAAAWQCSSRHTSVTVQQRER